MTTKRVPEPQLYSVNAAAAMLGVGRTTCWKLIKDGTLDTVFIGRRRMIRAASLYELIENGTARATQRLLSIQPASRRPR